MSETNVSRLLRRSTVAFANMFYTTDPRTAHRDWPGRVWQAISDSEVFVGMTPAQAQMSWGEPTRVVDTVVDGRKAEQWVYSDGSALYVIDNVVSGVQP